MRLRLYAEEVTESEGGNGLGWINVKDHGAVGDGVADDTAAIQAAIDAATNGGVIYFPDGIYQCGGTLVLPMIDAGTQTQIAITFQGHSPQYKTLSVTRSVQTPTGGSIIKSTANPIIKTPGPGWSNVTFGARDITFRGQLNKTGLDLRKAVSAELDNVTVDIGVWGYVDAPEPTSVSSYGIRTPENNNGAWTVLRNVTVAGFWNGIECFEHTDCDNSQVWFCKSAFVLPAAVNYPSRFGRILVVDCKTAIYVSGVHHFSVEQLAMEHYNPAYSGPGWFEPVNHLSDPGNNGYGRIRYHVVKGGVGLNNSLWNKNGGANIHDLPIGAP